MTLAHLLTIPEAPGKWLKEVAAVLTGYRPCPMVLRHQVRPQLGRYSAEVEVRRRSQEGYLLLNAPHLLLDGRGRIWSSQFQRRRWIRQSAEEQVYDEVFQLVEVPQPEREMLELVLRRFLEQRGRDVWLQWEFLDDLNREKLVRAEHSWEVLDVALSGPERALQILPLLLGPCSAPKNRSLLLKAGEEGRYTPPAEALPWLILQVEWNLSPGVLGLARAAIARHPQTAWEVRRHPNPVVRRRLVQLLPERQPWLDWLTHEADSEVRQALRLRLEQEYHPAQLVDLAALETDPVRRAALGWLLVNWTRPSATPGLTRVLAQVWGRGGR